MTQPDLGHDRALYSISVTSELTGVNPQMLRVYESKGLLDPYRTTGGTRRYSGRDLDRISEITTLLAAGLNLAGVEHVLRLQVPLPARRLLSRFGCQGPRARHRTRS
jgi:MerR family transcriptional regulator/heat shock protein HspR